MKKILTILIFIISYNFSFSFSLDYFEAVDKFQQDSLEKSIILFEQVINKMESENDISNFYAYVYIAEAYHLRGEDSKGKAFLIRGNNFLSKNKEVKSHSRYNYFHGKIHDWMENYPHTNKSNFKDISFYESEEMPSLDMVAFQKRLVYPDIARRAEIEGKVIVRVLVGTEGTPKKVLVLDSDSKIFDQAVIDAVIQSKFKPAKIDGKPVKCWVSIPVTFKLKEEKKNFFERLFGL